MRKKLTKGAAILACSCLVALSLSSCTPGTETKAISFADASGSGTVVSTVNLNLGNGDNTGTYVKDAEKIASHLQSKVDELTQTSGVYTVSFEGENTGIARIKMAYSFADINDYNRKTMRLFNSVPISFRNSVGGMGNDYYYASWELSDNGDGTYEATFSQNGHALGAMNLWAYKYLISNDIPDAWDNTGDGQAAQFAPIGSNAPTSSIIDFGGSTVTLTVGDTSADLTVYDSAWNVQTVSLTGTVSGTPVSVDLSVTDEDIIVEPAPEEAVSPEGGSGSGAGIHPYITAAIAVAAVAAFVITLLVTGRNGNKKGDGENA